MVHEGASLTAQVEYRVLALGGEFDEAASNIVEVSFKYPDAPEAPVLKRVSVLDRTRVELVLATRLLAEEGLYGSNGGVNGRLLDSLKQVPVEFGLPRLPRRRRTQHR